MIRENSVRIVIDGFAQAQKAPQGVIMPPLPKPMRDKYFVKMYTPADVRKWQLQARQIASEQLKGLPPLKGALAVRIWIYLPLPKSMPKKNIAPALSGDIRPVTRPDCDNYCKAVQDTLNGIAWLDDSQIVDLSVSKWYGEKPRVEIEAREIATASRVPVAKEQPALFPEKKEPVGF